MDDIHDTLGLSMEQTRWMLRRIVDGENSLIADMLVINPMQMVDVMLCAVTMIEHLRAMYPAAVNGLFEKELPN